MPDIEPEPTISTSAEHKWPFRPLIRSIGRSVLTVAGVFRERNQYRRERVQHPLTGLANNVWMRENLPGIIEENPGRVGVLEMDVDHLKNINDEHGHSAGDKLLIKAADTLRKTTKNDPEHPDRVGDTAVHISGDEFAVVAPGISNQEDLDALRQRLEAGLLEGGISATIDGVVHSPGETSDDLLHRADDRMLVRKAIKKLDNLTFEQGLRALKALRILKEGDEIPARDLPAIFRALEILSAQQQKEETTQSEA